MEKANEKDRILYPEDAELLKEFLNKIISEIKTKYVFFVKKTY